MKHHFAKIPKPIRVLLHYAAAGALIAFVLANVDRAQLLRAFEQTHAVPVLLAYLSLQCAQIASALRMRFYLRTGGLELTPGYAVKLYYAGMFYNTVLPGGIGGDGMKALLLRRYFHFPFKKSVALLIAERANGLLLLLILLYVFASLSRFLTIAPSFAFPALAVITLLGYLVSVRILFKETLDSSARASLYSLTVQCFTTLAAAILFIDLDMQADLMAWLALFQVAGVVGVIPISIGGVGLREMTFLYGAPLVSLSGEQGVAFALLFFVLYFFSSLAALPFLSKLNKPQS